MKCCRTMFSLAAALALAGCSPEAPERLAARAEAAYADGQWAKAISAYEQLAAQTGGDAITYCNLALAAWRAQDFDYARTCLAKALTFNVGDATAERCRELQGILAEESGDAPAAAKIYRELLQARDGALRLRVRSRLARLFADKNCLDGAFALLLGAANESPSDATTLYNLGKLCLREPLNLRREALDWLGQAERQLPEGSPQRVNAHNFVGRLTDNLERLRQVPPAAGDAASAAESLKKSDKARHDRRWTSAETWAEKATAQDPSSFEAALALGQIRAQNNRKEQALKAYDAALVLQYRSTVARMEAASLAFGMKNYAKAAEYLRPALAVEPKNTALARLMAKILYSQRRFAEARLWGEYYLSLAPEDAKYRDWVKSLPETLPDA